MDQLLVGGREFVFLEEKQDGSPEAGGVVFAAGHLDAMIMGSPPGSDGNGGGTFQR